MPRDARAHRRVLHDCATNMPMFPRMSDSAARQEITGRQRRQKLVLGVTANRSTRTELIAVNFNVFGTK